jgi:hypothetical protein
MFRPGVIRLGCSAVTLGAISIALSPAAQDAGDENAAGVRRAVILIGLPGDEEHDTRFSVIAEAWRTWLTASMGFSPENVLILQGREGDAAATKENVTRQAKELGAESESDDALWVFVLAHADEDGRRARLHLPGPDVSDMEFAEWFAGVKCREQVFWLTHTCSSHFLRPLSRKGRVVITASAPDEGQNETEFPEALADITGKDAQELDKDEDGEVSLAELFVAVATEVTSRYAADKRVPTEHAQLDDNGDGRGTEADELTFTAQASDTPQSLRRDGAMAAKIYLILQATN